MPPFVLVFDLDGTLVDSVPDLHAAANAMLRQCGCRPISPGEVRRMVGDGVPALVGRALAASGGGGVAVKDALRHFLSFYEANAARLSRCYSGVRETLGRLRRSGYRTAICTNKPQRATIAVLQGLDLLPLFDAVAGGDRFAMRKPDPRHLLAVIAELGGATDRAAMVGDGENDAAAARAAAVPLILMRYGYIHGDPVSLGPDALLDNFVELPAALDRLGLTP
ncbi:MAG TPA: phosphoglycolate phosphatase [Stellaceae bacterium]